MRNKNYQQQQRILGFTFQYRTKKSITSSAETDNLYRVQIHRYVSRDNFTFLQVAKKPPFGAAKKNKKIN
jgi:hypothetical protein